MTPTPPDFQPITLGALLQQLEAQPQGNPIYFDFCGFAPDAVQSYRGYYDHLAFSTVKHFHTTVAGVVAMLRDAIGQVFEGYKGGDFRMSARTPMWVADYGESGSTAVLGAYDADGRTILATGYCAEWSGSEARTLDVIFGGLGFGNAHREAGA